MEHKQLRALHLGSIAAAVVLLLLGVLVLGGDAGARLLVILLLLGLLGVQLWLGWQDRKAAPAPAEGQPWEEPAAAPAEPQPARMVIKCKQCGEVFPVIDTGARPLVAACPHCGKSGTIKVKTDAAR